MGGVPAMSRPPSPANSRTMLDLSAAHATASASSARTLKEQEEMNDPVIQRAMAESLGQPLPGQENGVTGTGTRFGPAKRDFYEPANWAMTTFATSREIIDHPPPSKRRRTDDEPAFLRGSKETDYLGPLLTIYHSIPLAREALLMPGLKIHVYGHEDSWWSGTTDENTKALSTDNTLCIDRDQCHVLAEVQCLMAFLDKTHRAYGSVDALADLQAVRSSSQAFSFSRFLETWNAAALRQAPQEPLTQIFSSVAVKNSSSGDRPLEEKSLLSIGAPINRIPGETLVDLFDMTVWDDVTGNLDDVWIDHAADVFTAHVYDPANGKNGLELTVDPIWYPDRYMYEFREATQHMRKQLQLIRREIDQCTNARRRCEVLKLPDNRMLKIREVLDAVAKTSATALGQKSASNGLYDHQQPLSESAIAQVEAEQIASDLQNVLQRMDQKVQQLEQRKADLREKMRQISLQLTRPTPENPHIPHRKYTLQGVSTKPEITYVRQPNRDLLHLEEDQRNPEDSEFQWWKLCWLQDDTGKQIPPPPIMGPMTQAQAEAAKKTGNSWDENGDFSKPYAVSKVGENEVLEAVKKEHSSVLLVYANENAMKFRDSELNISLRHFVDRDNQAFAEEIQQEEGPMPNSSGDHEGEVEFEDVPLIDQTGSSNSVRGLTPVSASTPGRDEDEQPSPKRAKEDNSGFAAEQPPSYEESVRKQEMQERKGNKIGLYAEQMLQRYGSERGKGMREKDDGGSFMHIEHSD
ncbi:uncharacterized protein Z518_01274 [Rhinocladiella mackenziei CBS 650.93]|uniref:Ubiquitin interaction motif protein n=1 Tax=Rhinocladiella mackenziei CBS 650.93 TaxID=1442369 RepID=A0A0D2HHN6_9EURO|nr:uncharacterized protein Z518_01274 [Rhinocladiella mackenziei CBS 650.93]KIX10193.1 hypothetical protein Z518_01274 [Rhinocladiella mackenziei CBS 650.93]